MKKIIALFCLSFILLLSVPPLKAEHIELNWQITELPKKPSLRGSAIKNNTAWVSGSDNAVYITLDNGKTWLDRSVKGPIITDFRDIEVFDDKTAIVMGVGTGKQSVLYKTVDQGKTWQLLFENPDEEGFFDSIAFFDDKNGLLLGDPVDGYYVVMTTQDGGANWQRITKSAIPKMLEKEAAFAASGNTLIVGANNNAWFTTGGFAASVYHSVDGGLHWQRFTVPLHNKTQTSGGYGLGLNNAQQVFVLGGDYEHREATYANMAMNNSATWQLANAPQIGLRTAMACTQLMCLSTGKLFTDISYDQGATWQSFMIENTHQGFYTLAANNQTFVAAGHDGRVAIAIMGAVSR